MQLVSLSNSSPPGVAKVVLGILIYEAEQLVRAPPNTSPLDHHLLHCSPPGLNRSNHNVMIQSELSAQRVYFITVKVARAYPPFGGNANRGAVHKIYL